MESSRRRDDDVTSSRGDGDASPGRVGGTCAGYCSGTAGSRTRSARGLFRLRTALDAAGIGGGRVDEDIDYSSYGAMMTDESSPSSSSASSSYSHSSLLGDASSSSSSYTSPTSSMADAAFAVYLEEHAGGNDGIFDNASAVPAAAATGGEEGNADAFAIARPTPDAAETAEATAEATMAARAAARARTKLVDGDAVSRFEEDLELTRRVIMRHIERMSVDENHHVTDDNDDGDDETVIDDGNGKFRKSRTPSSRIIDATNHDSSDVVNINAVVAPTVPKILRYTLPAIGIWLCSPVLSMIDTAAVGLLAGTAQQAALNPAVSVSDYGALVVAFMYTATTNLVAAASREDRDDEVVVAAAAMAANDANGSTRPRPKTTRTLVTALGLASRVGTFLAIALYALGPRLLKLLIGNDASHLDPIIFSSALRYVRIRALGMPAMVTIGTAQSACLGMQDVRSPLYVLLAAAIVNFLGDVALVPLKGGWWGDVFGGAAGAAWATVASQYAALLFFMRLWLTAPKPQEAAATTPAKWKVNLLPFRKKSGGEGYGRTKVASSRVGGHLETDNLLPAAMTVVTTTSALARTDSNKNPINQWMSNERQKRRRPIAPSPSVTTSQNQAIRKTSTITRGFLSNSKLTLRSFLSPKRLDRSKAREFLPFVVPVTTTSLGRISGYIAMSHVASSTLGTIDMAGHQIILSIFCCITPFVDALSQVAQSLVPEVYAANGEGRRKSGRRERAMALQRTVRNFRVVGVGLGAVLVGLVSCIPLISRYFTTDASVLTCAHGAIPPVGLFMAVNGLMCAGEGERVVSREEGPFFETVFETGQISTSRTMISNRINLSFGHLCLLPHLHHMRHTLVCHPHAHSTGT
jgi:Na+-driven multidrug efflux pump